MEITRFALGIRMWMFEKDKTDQLWKLLLEPFTAEELACVRLSGGWDDTNCFKGVPVYLAVLMNGSIKQMRIIYEKIIANHNVAPYIIPHNAFVQNNELREIEEQFPVGSFDENGLWTAAKEQLQDLTVPREIAYMRRTEPAYRILVVNDSPNAQSTCDLLNLTHKHLPRARLLPFDAAEADLMEMAVLCGAKTRQEEIMMRDHHKVPIRYAMLQGKTAAVDLSQLAADGKIPAYQAGKLIKRIFDDGFEEIVMTDGNMELDDGAEWLKAWNIDPDADAIADKIPPIVHLDKIFWLTQNGTPNRNFLQDKLGLRDYSALKILMDVMNFKQEWKDVAAVICYGSSPRDGEIANTFEKICEKEKLPLLKWSDAAAPAKEAWMQLAGHIAGLLPA